MSRATEGFSAMISVFTTGHLSEGLGGRRRPERPWVREFVTVSAQVADGDTWRDDHALLRLRGHRQPAAEAGLSPALDGHREPPEGGRLRARGQPPLEPRSVADRALALPAAAGEVHGEGGAVLVPASPPAELGRGVPGRARHGRPERVRSGGSARQGRRGGGDVPPGHEAVEGDPEDAAAEGVHGRRADRDRRRRPDRARGDLGHGPPDAARPDADRLRAAACARGAAAAAHGPGDGRDRAPAGNAVTDAARPLLIIDGDSLSHRAYHALPKTIRRGDGRPAGALVGFANFLLRLWEAESPRAVFVGWDTLFVPTYRNEALPGYQGGREFDDAIVEQLDLLPQLVSAFGFATAKGEGYEADDFLAAAARSEEARGGTALVATSDRDAFQLASDRVTILQPVRGVSELRRVGPAPGTEGCGRPAP